VNCTKAHATPSALAAQVLAQQTALLVFRMLDETLLEHAFATLDTQELTVQLMKAIATTLV
jgi:hypothetical protein